MGVVVGIVAFVSELALLVATAVLGWSIGQGIDSTAVGLVAATVLPLATATAWGLWLAPRARNRLPDMPRLLSKCVLFAVVGLLVAATASPVWGLILVVCGVGSALAGQRFRFPGADATRETETD